MHSKCPVISIFVYIILILSYTFLIHNINNSDFFHFHLFFKIKKTKYDKIFKYFYKHCLIDKDKRDTFETEKLADKQH